MLIYQWYLWIKNIAMQKNKFLFILCYVYMNIYVLWKKIWFVIFQEMKHVSVKLERLSHKGSADDLYDSIRQSSRGPMTGRQGNKLEMKGYLYIKKSSKHF